MKQFLSVSEAAHELGLSEQHVRDLINRIKAYTPDRYYPADVFGGRGKRAVRFVALQDCAAYSDDFDTAPAYDPIEREIELGIVPETGRAVSARDVAAELADILVAAFAREATC